MKSSTNILTAFLRAWLLAILALQSALAATEAEPNDTAGTAQGISLGEEITGSISSSRDYDYYSLELNQSGELTLSFSADESSSVGWTYEIYDPTGNLLVGSSCSYDTCRSGEILTAGISSAGVHIVKIKSRYSSTAPDGNYTFSVSFEADVVDARDSVQRLYVAYFNRPADPVSLVSFLDMLPSEPTFEGLLALAERYFSPSREYLDLYSGMSNAEIVNTLYQNLFSRDAEPAGLIHWTERLNNGQETIATIALQLTFSAQGTDAKVIRNKIAVANQFTQSVSTTVANITGYSGNDAAASARNWLRKVDHTDLAFETAISTLEQAVKDAVAATDRDGDGVPDNRDGEPNDPAQTPPTAVITLSAKSGRTPQLVNFNGDKSIAGNTSNSFVSFDWDFGDGNTASGAQVSHTYVEAGVWTVSLSVENDTALTHTVTEEITIAEFEGPISVSGTISLSGFQFADSDVNDSQSEPVSNNSLNSAQAIPNPSIISGYVNEAGEGPDFDDGGKSKDSGDLFDYFVFNAVGGETLRLLIADTTNDLDLALYDENFNLVAYSVAPAGSSDEVVIVPDAPGTYYAEVTPYAGASAYNLTIDTTSVKMSSFSSAANLMIGDVVVNFRQGHSSLMGKSKDVGSFTVKSKTSSTMAGQSRLFSFGANLQGAIGSLRASRSAWALRSALKTAGKGELEVRRDTHLMAKEMANDPAVEFAEPNYLIQPLSVEPNDQYYGLQWHYGAIDLPKAWSTTTGIASTRIAVLDTGIADHPDIASRLTADGFDFVSSLGSSGDGDGIDGDPTDPGDGSDNTQCGDSSDPRSSFHGTHVAGTIGASTNNRLGVAGVTWSPEIMDVRVLGCGGGSDWDVSQGILYAAGLSNSSGLLPNRRADIINMSLGSSYPSELERRAIADAVRAGVIIVAAAGNSAQEGNPIFYPAAFPGVISVGATSLSGIRAPYSTYNSYVDIAAPGGDMTKDVNGDGYGDGVLSTHAEIRSSSVDYGYLFYQGTSMAAPHVSGVLALMEAVTDLSPEKLDDVISAGRLTVDIGNSGRDNEFGMGLISASKAVDAAIELASGAAGPDNPSIGVSSSRINLGRITTSASFDVFNSGSGNLFVTAITTSSSALSIVPPDSANGLGSYLAVLERNGLDAGSYAEQITIKSDSTETPEVTLTIFFEVSTAVLDADTGVMWINFYEVNTETSNWYYWPNARRGEYVIAVTDLPAGVYYIYAGTDPDNDGYVGGLTEAYGVYPSQDDPALVIGNRDLTGIDLYAPYEQPLNSSLSRKVGSDASIKYCYLPTIDGDLTLPKPRYDDSSGGEAKQLCKASRAVPQ